MMRSESGGGPTTMFETSDLECRISCEVKGFEPLDYMTRKQVRRLDPVSRFALGAAHQAMADAAIDASSLSDDERDCFGVIFGSGIGGFSLIEEQLGVLAEKGPGKVSPFFVPMILPNTTAGLISIEHDLRGPNHCVVSACATGSHNLADALMLLRHGYADAVLAGGSDHITRAGAAGFAAMKALSTRNDSRRQPAARATAPATAWCPARAPAPWCSRLSSTPRRAAPGSTPSLPALAPPPTPATTFSRGPMGAVPRAP